jgi:hypothetical protein
LWPTKYEEVEFRTIHCKKGYKKENIQELRVNCEDNKINIAARTSKGEPMTENDLKKDGFECKLKHKWMYDYKACRTDKKIIPKCFELKTFTRVHKSNCIKEPPISGPHKECNAIINESCTKPSFKGKIKKIMDDYDFSEFTTTPLENKMYESVKCKKGLVNDFNAELRVKCSNKKFKIVHDMKASEMINKGLKCKKPHVEHFEQVKELCRSQLTPDKTVKAKTNRAATKQCLKYLPDQEIKEKKNKFWFRKTTRSKFKFLQEGYDYECYWSQTIPDMKEKKWCFDSGVFTKVDVWEASLSYRPDV